jgi:hypothetical protein
VPALQDLKPWVQTPHCLKKKKSQGRKENFWVFVGITQGMACIEWEAVASCRHFESGACRVCYCRHGTLETKEPKHVITKAEHNFLPWGAYERAILVWGHLVFKRQKLGHLSEEFKLGREQRLLPCLRRTKLSLEHRWGPLLCPSVKLSSLPPAQVKCQVSEVLPFLDREAASPNSKLL